MQKCFQHIHKCHTPLPSYIKNTVIDLIIIWLQMPRATQLSRSNCGKLYQFLSFVCHIKRSGQATISSISGHLEAERHQQDRNCSYLHAGLCVAPHPALRKNMTIDVCLNNDWSMAMNYTLHLIRLLFAKAKTVT